MTACILYLNTGQRHKHGECQACDLEYYRYNKCKHNKVYANYILTSNPPQSPWICSKCGFKGVDRGQFPTEETYEDIDRRFNAKPKLETRTIMHGYTGGE
jgi:hypothetical protein